MSQLRLPVAAPCKRDGCEELRHHVYTLCLLHYRQRVRAFAARSRARRRRRKGSGWPPGTG